MTTDNTRNAGKAFPGLQPYGSLQSPVFHTSLFVFESVSALCAFKELEKHTGHVPGRFEYGRYGNPTVSDCEADLARLEGAEDAILFPSGMSALTTAFFTLLVKEKKTHAIVGAECYRRTRVFFETTLKAAGVETTVLPMDDFAQLERHIRPNTELVFLESPTNPYLRIVDVEEVAAITRRNGVKLVVDPTFASPFNFRALELGADLVIPSASKYLNGHNDLLAGAVLGNEDLLVPIRQQRGILGCMPSAGDAFQIIRGLKTFELRMERQNRNGFECAQFLEQHHKVSRVWYPGLESHPDHCIAEKQFKGFGGVVTFELKGGTSEMIRFLDALKIPKIGPSFGGTEALIEPVALMSFYEKTTEERKAVGISDTLIRFAVGTHATDELMEDLRQALEEV